jgi:hypothetical protein
MNSLNVGPNANLSIISLLITTRMLKEPGIPAAMCNRLANVKQAERGKDQKDFSNKSQPP